MRVVHKFVIREGTSEHPMPAGAKLVRFGFQPEIAAPVFWALVDTDRPMAARKVAVVDTGEAVPGSGEYVGTIQVGPAVLHLFDLGDDAVAAKVFS